MDQHIVAVRDENLPVLRARVIFRSGDNLKVFGVLVGPDVEEVLAMVDVIAVLLIARQEDREAGLWVSGAQVSDLGGVSAADVQQQICFVPGLAYVDSKQFVFFLVDRFK